MVRRNACVCIIAVAAYAGAVLAGDGRDQESEGYVETSCRDGASWLERGFANGDTQPLTRFLEAWHKYAKPVTADELAKKPEFEREAYAAYRAFFAPDNRYLEKNYVMIQKELETVLVDDDMADIRKRVAALERFREFQRVPLQTISRIVLKDFRPSVAVNGPKVIYLDDNHLHELLSFLVAGREEEPQYSGALVDSYWAIPHGADPFHHDPEKREDTVGQRRLDYLNTQLEIVAGHWETGWHFETHPMAYRMYLSRDRKVAVVEYREHFGGGEVYLEKDDHGKWKVIAREDSWIE